MRVACAAAVLLALGACEREASFYGHTVLGDTVVMVSQGPAFPDTATMVLVQQIGSFDGSIENEFRHIEAFAVDEAGGIYVFDSGTGLKHFTRAGSFGGWIARTGRGPDEIACTAALAARAGTVAAVDHCNGRLSVFSPSSSPLSVPLPAGMPRWGEDALFFDEHGYLWVGINPPFPVEGGISFPRPIAVRLEGTEFVDTIYAPRRYAEECPTLSEGWYRAGFWEDKREQWWPKVKWALGADGNVAYGCPRRFRFDVLRKDGTVLRVEKPWRPVRTTADERSFYAEWWQPIPPLPQERPAYARVILSPDGRIWVWPEQPSEPLPYNEESRLITGREHGWQPGTRGAFEVFASDGRWLGAVRVPPDLRYSGYPTTRPIVVRGDTLWGVIRDSLDVQYLGRLQVRWGAATF